MNSHYSYDSNYKSSILSHRQLKRLEIDFIRQKVSSDYLRLKDEHNFKLFHLTITWNNWKTSRYKSLEEVLSDESLERNQLNQLNRDLNALYRHHLVKYACDVNRISKNNRHIQPIFVSFIDEGSESNKLSSSNCNKLHHHCLVAARDETAQRLLSLCGENTLKPMCAQQDIQFRKSSSRSTTDFRVYDAICTTDLKEITNDEVQTRYPSKMLDKFDEQYMLKFNYPIDFDSFCTSMSDVLNAQ
jgi:hypothetical protein